MLRHLADPTPDATKATLSRRRARSAEFAEVAAVVESADFRRMGYRSATDWLAATTRESFGHCKTTLGIAVRLGDMPIVSAAFADGLIAETALRTQTEAWHLDVADVFARDEQMLTGWACTLGQKDLRLVVDTWRMHADPNREERTAEERFDSRSLHPSSLLDGLGRIDRSAPPCTHTLNSPTQPADARPLRLAQCLERQRQVS